MGHLPRTLSLFKPPFSFADLVVNSLLRGTGQVYFMNSPLTGLLIWIGLLWQDWRTALIGLAGLLGSTLTAYALHINTDLIRNGLYGFNGLLVGLGLGTLYFPGYTAGRAGAGFAVSSAFLMGGFSSFFTAGIGAVLVKHYRTPSFTLPFNICLMLMLGAVAPGDLTHFPASVFPGVHKDAARGAALELTHLSVLDGLAAIPKGVGQIFFADKLGPCLIITLAILPCSLIGLVAACLGSAVGVCMALFYGASPAAIAIGLWGYNGVLGAIAIFGMFFVPTARSLVMSIACAALSTSLFAAIRVWLGNVFLPAGTFGFCFATILICLMRDDIPHLLTVPLHKVSTPEHHLIDAKRKRDRRREREREGK